MVSLLPHAVLAAAVARYFKPLLRKGGTSGCTQHGCKTPSDFKPEYRRQHFKELSRESQKQMPRSGSHLFGSIQTISLCFSHGALLPSSPTQHGASAPSPVPPASRHKWGDSGLPLKHSPGVLPGWECSSLCSLSLQCCYLMALYTPVTSSRRGILAITAIEM